MFSLAPDWLQHYDEFWNAVQKRNIWFIKLRFGAIAGLIAFIAITDKLLNFNYTSKQLTILYVLTAILCLYNIVLSIFRNKINTTGETFNPLHFSLLQICVDLTILMLLVYFAGGIETPLYMLFVFHMIIGSLILPNYIIKTLAALVVVIFTGILFLQNYGMMDIYHAGSMYGIDLFQHKNYLWTFSIIFASVIFITVLITGNIARLLYKMEQELFVTIDKLHSAEADKQKYIMSVVHEIKTPLAALHSYLDVILNRYLGPINDRIEDSLLKAKHRSTEGIELIDNILKISKLRLSLDVVKEEVDIDDVIETIVKKYKSLAEHKEIKLCCNDERNIKKNITGDQTLLELAFSNLISNALKYVHSKGDVLVKLEDNTDFLYISISDNGLGIPEKDLENIFKDFYRASNARREIEGTGFGLSIVKQIINRHGGEIVAYSPSEIGEIERPGATFKIDLPYSV